MKTLIQKFILSGLAVIMLFGFASNVFAQASLDVVFDPDPLFNEANFLPGDETSGEVTVTNNSGTAQDILTEAINILDNDNFGSLLHLKIVGSSGTLFDDSLSGFFSTAGEVSLGVISNGESKIFTYTISFIDSSDNSYQEKTLGFDVCVGFEGGDTRCGDTVVGGENDTGGGGGGGGGGSSGGGGGGPIILTIVNEQTVGLLGFPIATATITWNTNVLATSQVIYGLASGAPYILDINNLPNFGYPFGTVEDPIKVINHSVLLTGLIPGETYLYRVVSRASPPTISFEHQFTVPLAGPLLAQAPSGNLTGGILLPNTTNGSVPPVTVSDEGGDADIIPEEGTPLEEDTVSLNDNLVAAVLAAGFNDLISICTLIGLLILLAFYLVWKFGLRKENEKRVLLEMPIQDKFFEFFGGFTLFAIVVAILIKEYCVLPIFLITFVISLITYFFKKLKK